MRCSTCSVDIPDKETYEYNGQTLCEDCYLDLIAKPKTCDPWAVYQAKQTASQDPQLTETQRDILSILQEEGPVSRKYLCSRLGLDDDQFQTSFAPLRHMELARACQVEGEKRFTTFDDQV
jgi:hypothetical protein